MKYYLVVAKCGHVGKRKYVEVEFPIYAESKSEAAQNCLKRGKVKKHLKNAITSVCEITYEYYQELNDQFSNNKFVHAHTKSEISEFIEEAVELERHQSWKKSFANRAERIAYLLKKKKIKEDYQYAQDF